jgi:hypothetical protein
MLRPLVLTLACMLAATAADELAAIPRRLPAPGVPLPEAERATLEKDLAALAPRLAKAGAHAADAQVFAKAVIYALRFDEFYDLAKDVPKAHWALAQAAERLDHLDAAPWAQQPGPQALAYVSAIDGSVQPYGVVIPEHLPAGKPVPLYVWLHGRDEKGTDLHFLWARAHDKGEVHPDDAIVVHAFGRQCIGFKSAGESDVIDVVEAVKQRYQIDPERVVLMGFSMGGGGSKQVAAHFTDHYCTIHTGAGFAETARFCHLKKEEYPPLYEQTLWQVYDVPNYVRNLFNVPFSCYSGEKDGQKQAADVLDEAFAGEGRKLVQYIGPGAGHWYEKATLARILGDLHEQVAAGRPHDPPALSLQTRTLRYPRMFWLQAEGLEHHWQDARIDATAQGAAATLATTNLTRVRVAWPGLAHGGTVTIDGQAVTVPAAPAGATLVKDAGKWRPAAASDDADLRKRPGLQGPIDDIFMEPFLVVMPSGTSPNARFQRWMEFESKHFRERWAGVLRGELREKKDSEVTADDLARYHVLAWGDAASNALIARTLAKLPIAWDATDIHVGAQAYPSASHALALVQPNPLSPGKYLVLNSGVTFRESDDRNNAMQNPKLPDWAVIDLDKAPDEHAAGGITAAGFFDEAWKLP